MKKYNISQIAWLLCLLLAMTGCSNEMSSSFSDDGEIRPGDPVMFTTYVQGKALTRTYADETAFNTDMATYHDASSSYAFTYEIYKSGEDAAIAYGSTVYWPDNVNAYGFKATAGSATLGTNQTTANDLLAQDKLIGYGFEPLWSGDAPVDNIEGLNYRTCGNWKAANISRSVPEADQKKIPLYLKHQRSKITIILKASEGVNHEDLALSTATTNIDATIYSYSGGSTTEVKPYASETTISTVTYTQYTAIVEPYDYQTNSDKVIARISVSGQPFTFSVNNESDNEKKSNYNLTAGKHLVITATLARGNAQKVLLTAQVVPWTEVSIDATVGDDGQIGTTTDINDLAALKAFLSDNDINKQGNIANITANINLEDGGDWTSQPLNCTMKLNNHTISTTHPVFTTIGALGKVEGGTISVSGDATEVTAAVATTNLGTIKEVTVSRSSTGKASQGGLVVTNSGTISSCSSTLPVHGTSGDVGGIAMKSVYSTIGSMPVIENCTVDARVDGETGTYGGGIVGRAVGRVSGNTFAYGITLNQNANDFKNIVLAKADSHELRAYDNKWPTKADNSIGDHSYNNSNTTTATKYDATIDSSDELWTLLMGVYTTNIAGKNYRVNCDFTVVNDASSAHWDNNISGRTALFHLDGNGKNITTYPSDLVLFANVSTATTNLKVNNVLVSTTP
jgi:hypothetical protein